MDDHAFGLAELLFVFGIVVAWALWEIRTTRRALRNPEKPAEERDPPAA